MTCWRGDLKVFVAYRPRRIIAQVLEGASVGARSSFVTLWSSETKMTIGKCEMTSLAGLKTCKARSTSHVWCVVDAGGDSQLTPRRGGLEYSLSSGRPLREDLLEDLLVRTEESSRHTDMGTRTDVKVSLRKLSCGIVWSLSGRIL